MRVTTEASSRSVDVTYFFCGEMPAPETLGQDLQGRDVVGVRAGRVINRFKVSKFFVPEFEDARFRYRIDEAAVSREAELDGIYVIRTNVPTRAAGRGRMRANLAADPPLAMRNVSGKAGQREDSLWRRLRQLSREVLDTYTIWR